MDNEFLETAETLFSHAAVDPALWENAFGAVAQHAGAVGLNLVNASARSPLIFPMGRAADLFEEHLEQRWYERDPRYRGAARLKSHGIVVDQDIVTPDEMRHLPYYTDHLIRGGLGWFAGIKVETGNDLWCVTLHRGMREGAFEQAEQEHLVRLSGVISRAAKLAALLDAARLDGAADTSEAIGVAAMFVNQFGRVIRMNAKAEAMAGTVFQIRDGAISLVDGTAKSLQRHIEATLWRGSAADSSAFEPVVMRQGRLRPVVFQAYRLRGMVGSLFGSAAAIVTVTDLASASRPSVRNLRAVVNFTVAEARLVLALLQHFSLVDAARAAGLSHETVRSQLKGILAKAGARNQAELIDIVNRIGSDQ